MYVLGLRDLDVVGKHEREANVCVYIPVLRWP